MEKPKDKVVFLFGAGAVIDWGGPKTLCDGTKPVFIEDNSSQYQTTKVCCLTHLIINIGSKDKENKRITKKIYDALRENYKDSQVNFETIINIIEDFHGYWAQKGLDNPYNLNSLISIDDKIRHFANFNLMKDPDTNRYKFSVPGFEDKTEESLIDDIEPNLKFFEWLLNHILGGIKSHIYTYADSTDTQNLTNKPTNIERNQHFYNWMARFVEANSILRMYTLNYDRLFKVILEENGLEVFEGFDNSPGTNIDESKPLDLPRIISDFNSNVYYNLHGSAFWDIDFDDSLPSQRHRYTLVPFGGIENPSIAIEIEKGRKLIASNIITGYQKVQRTAIAPFRQMFSAFDRDCFEASKIVIVGYSMGDEHINDIIRNAKKYNTAVKITIITRSFGTDDELAFFNNFLISWGAELEDLSRFKGNMDTLFENYKIKILRKTFDDFLKSFRS